MSRILVATLFGLVTATLMAPVEKFARENMESFAEVEWALADTTSPGTS